MIPNVMLGQRVENCAKQGKKNVLLYTVECSVPQADISTTSSSIKWIPKHAFSSKLDDDTDDKAYFGKLFRLWYGHL